MYVNVYVIYMYTVILTDHLLQLELIDGNQKGVIFEIYIIAINF